MATEVDKNNVDTRIGNPWYEAAKGAAFVAGVFSVIVSGILIVNYLQIKLLDPLRAERLERLKTEVLEEPENEQMLTRIRQLDLTNRQDTVRHRDFSRKGTFLLLGGIAVFLVSIKSAQAFRRKYPHPMIPSDQQARQVKQVKLTRWALTGVLALIAGGVLFFATSEKIEFKEVKALYPSEEEIAVNWPSFRGPHGSGVSGFVDIPQKWDAGSGEGILWKTEIPLPGHNSPVIWNDRVFLSGADQKKSQVYCFDTKTGKLLWQGDVEKTRASNGKELELDEATGYAASTVVTDGRRVCAIFPTGDIACFDFDGRKLWARNFGLPESTYGYASSLAIYRNLIVVQYDQGMAEDNKSKIIALDSFTGQTMWETKRPVPNSWTSPVVVKVGEHDQIITCGDPWVIAYNPLDGAELWRAECMGTDAAPSLVYAGGFVAATHPYTKLVAIDPAGRGDVTKTNIRWKAEGNMPDICSPVSNGEFIFTLDSQGGLSCYKVSDGTLVWQETIKGSFIASPSLAGDRLYLLSEKGEMIIAKFANGYTEVGRCQLGEKCYASPAFADGRVYIRADKNLYCIGSRN